MKFAITFLLFSVAFAQTNQTNTTNSTTTNQTKSNLTTPLIQVKTSTSPFTVEQTIEALEKSFKGIQADYLQATSVEKNWTAIVGNATTYGLNGTISFITSILGITFLSVEMNLVAPSANF